VTNLEAVSFARRSKTWDQLAGVRRKPSEYEVVSHNLNYHFNRADAPFELDPSAPLNAWYLRYREGSPLRVDDWNEFRDPSKLTYRTYVEQQSRRETYLDGVVDRYEADAHRCDFSREWIETLSRSYLTSRYSCHVLQMVAMYLAQISPASYITNCAEFQAGDEMRRIQRMAYRAKALADGFNDPALGESKTARTIWETDEAWQPLRECLEQLLVAYDFGEAFVALNLCVKPMHDGLMITELARVAQGAGDEELALVLGDFDLDSARSREWSSALARYAIDRAPENRELIASWIQRWQPQAKRGIDALAHVVAPEGGLDRIQRRVRDAHEAFLSGCGLSGVGAG